VLLTPRQIVGIALIGLALACAVLADALAPHDPLRSSVAFLSPPTTAHVLGTDELGRDVFSRVIYGARTSLLIGFGAAVLAMIIGAPVGLLAGYMGGRFDVVIVMLIDLFVALPGLVLAIREATFIEAARAAGGTPAWIISRHVWPNTMRVVTAQFAISVSFAIFTSSSLSFLGLGIPPPTPDWGGMVRSGYDFLAINPLLSLGPGTAVAMTVLGFYLVGSSVE
jgi:peptide/nickel transport system permease protein